MQRRTRRIPEAKEVLLQIYFFEELDTYYFVAELPLFSDMSTRIKS